jgi:hypothetical protein
MANSFSGCELTRDRQLRLAYTKFFKTGQGKTFCKTFGKTILGNNGHRHAAQQANEDALDFCDPRPAARKCARSSNRSYRANSNGGVELDGISYDEIKIAAVIFKLDALVHRWKRTCRERSALGRGHRHYAPGFAQD